MHVVDISIIVAFLLATLYIGFSSGKKIKTFSDYAIGNRKFSDFAICCTVAATCIGGSSTMGGVGKAYEIGITQFLAQIGMPISFIIIGSLLAHRFCNYYGCCSLGDMFFKSYGTIGKVLVGITGCIYEILSAGMQLMAMGIALSVLTGLPYIACLLISGGIIFIYTGRGGIKAVTFTDILQFVVIMVAIPILLITVISKIGGIHALVENLPQSHVTITGENFNRYLFLMFPLMLPTLSPIHVQRLLMTSNKKQGKKAYYNLCWIYLLVVIMTIFLGLSARVLFPALHHTDRALFTIISNCLPVGIFGVAVIGILAVLMSTADSTINSGSIMLVNDIILPFIKKEVSDAQKLKMSRISSFVIGIAAIIVISQATSLFEVKVFMRTLWLSIILGPLYFALFNMKISIRGLILSALIGLFTFIFWNVKIKPITKIDGLFPGLFANMITVLFFYFLGGRQKVFSKEKLEKIDQCEKAKTKKRLNVRDLQMRNNTILGLCLVFLQLMPLVFNANSLTYSKLMLTLVNGTMAILLIFGGSLELFEKGKRFQWLKLTTLFFCLPITSAYLFLTSSENGLHALTLLFSFIVMLSSVEKKQEAPMGIACFLTAFLTLILYFLNNCQLYWPETFAWKHSFYVIGYVAVLSLLRSNLNTLQQVKEQEKEIAIHRERYNMARSLSHDLISPLMAFHLLIENKKSGVFDEKEYQLLKNIATEMGDYVNDFIIGGLKTYAQLKPEDLNQCAISCIEKQKILNKNIEIQLQAQETILARVDTVLLRRIINNLLNVCRHTLPKDCSKIVIVVDYDSLNNPQILLQAASGGFSAKALNSMFIEDQKLGDEVELGISFPEFQDIVAKWHGKLQLIAQNDNAIIQILLPNKDNDSLTTKD
ncbi:MAG: sodium:solute symporter family transporter [Opitutales bacterium]